MVQEIWIRQDFFIKSLTSKDVTGFMKNFSYCESCKTSLNDMFVLPNFDIRFCATFMKTGLPLTWKTWKSQGI